MMGERTVMQEALFYGFSLERHVPADHLLRSVDRFVDLSGLREQLRPFYSETGRPSIDPELIIRMLLVGYCFGIRSERRLCEEVHLNLAYRWFCRLGLEDEVPDHSTFGKNRHGRFRESDLFALAVFEDVLGFPVHEVVKVLHAHDRRELSRLLDLFHADFREADVADLTFLLQVPKRVELVLERHLRIDAV